MGILKWLFGKKSSCKLYPECDFIVTVDERGVECKRPNGDVEFVPWDDLRGVTIRTTDQGPAVADVFWVLVGEKGGCMIPQGATGEEVLMQRLQQLPGFNNEAVIQAMTCTENSTFICWDKDKSAEPGAARDAQKTERT